MSSLPGAEGLSEGEIFTKHIFKNVGHPRGPRRTRRHNSEPSPAQSSWSRSTLIPGVGGLLVQAIGAYDNAVIVGVALFYGILFIISAIMGDILMAVMDPRISYTSKAR